MKNEIIRRATWAIMIVTLGLAATDQADADDTNRQGTAKYLCIADQATGFHWNGKTWEKSGFLSGSKYIVAFFEFPDSSGWWWRPFSGWTHSPGMMCEFWGASEYLEDDADEILCASSLQTFQMNFDTQRFFHVYRAGYINGDVAEDTPNISIGTCTKL